MQARERRLQAIGRRRWEVDERLYPDPARQAAVVSLRRGLWERRPASICSAARPQVDVLIDFDMVSGVMPGQLAVLGDLIFQGRDAGIHVVLARQAWTIPPTPSGALAASIGRRRAR